MVYMIRGTRINQPGDQVVHEPDGYTRVVRNGSTVGIYLTTLLAD